MLHIHLNFVSFNLFTFKIGHFSLRGPNMHSVASARIPQWRRLNRLKNCTLRLSSTSKGSRSSWGWSSPSSSGGSIPGPPPVLLLMRRNSASVLAVFLFCCSFSDTAFDLFFVLREENFVLKISLGICVPKRRLKLLWTHVQASLTFNFWLSYLRTKHRYMLPSSPFLTRWRRCSSICEVNCARAIMKI